MTPLILASASPRRRELLDELGLSFSVLTSGAEDDLGLDPRRPMAGPAEVATLATRIALSKAKDVARRVAPGPLVLAADTVVALPGEPVIGKPADLDDARAMVTRLANREHLVVTGLALINSQDGQVDSVAEVSHVRLEASPAALHQYLESGQWQGKAGAYGIQDTGTPIVTCRGSVTNVIGLPLVQTAELLATHGLNHVSIEQATAIETTWHRRIFGPEPAG